MSGRFRSNPHAVLGVLVILAGLSIAAGQVCAAVHLTDLNDGTANALQYLGASVAMIPDLNGDGRDELLVGVPGDNRGGASAGAVFMWFGASELTVAPDRIWEGVPGERLGWSVAWIGDVDDDGTADFALGAPNYSQDGADKGQIYVIYGSANVAASGSAAAAADEIIVGEIGGDQFGYAVSAAGDFDDDGADDLLVGAPYSNKRAAAAGAAYVIYGSGSGPDPDLSLATCFTGQVADDNLGWSVAAAGNFLGGTAQSVAIGAPGNNLHGGANAGAVFVYEGSLNAADPDTAIDFAAGVSAAAKADSKYGWTVRGRGRWDNDSYDDLAVGAPFCNEGAAGAGRVEIIYGDPIPDPTGDLAANGATSGDALGHGLDWVRDPSAGNDDLLIGAPWYDSDGANAGRAYLWERGTSPSTAGGMVQLPVTPLVPGTAPEDEYGFWVASAGDFDGDGQADLAVSAPVGNDIDNVFAGYVHLMDSSGGVVANLLRLWRAEWADAAAVRLEFALAMPGSEVYGLRLIRRTAAGTSVLWDGPPALTEGLLRTGDGYVFVDTGVPTDLAVGYELTITAVDGTATTLTALAGPTDAAPQLPDGLVLGSVWPNPANPSVTIRYRGEPGQVVDCAIFDMRGRLVRELRTALAGGAWETVTWDGRTDSGSDAASGAYLVLLRAESGTRVGRLTLAR